MVSINLGTLDDGCIANLQMSSQRLSLLKQKHEK